MVDQRGAEEKPQLEPETSLSEADLKQVSGGGKPIYQ
jgi:hypothetical protein